MYKKSLSSLLIAGVLLSFSGCGNSGPDENAVSFFNALKDGDVSSYQKYSTQSTQQLMALGMGMKCGMKNMPFDTDDDKSECMKFMIEEFDSFEAVETKEISEDRVNVVVAELKKDGTTEKETVPMRKVDDVWKVDMTK